VKATEATAPAATGADLDENDIDVS